MAEPVTRTPDPGEPLRRPGPQPVRAATAERAARIDAAHELPPPAGNAAGARARTARTRTSTAAPPASTRPAPARTPSQEMLDELRTRLEELRERVEKQTIKTGASLKRELSQDAEYVKNRALYYHEHRPLYAVGVVATATFFLGLLAGLWRR